MFLKDCIEGQKDFIQKYRNNIMSTLANNYDDFIFSLKNSEAIDESGNINHEKIRLYGEIFSNALYNILAEENVHVDAFMQNALMYYDLHDDINLLALICCYYELVRGWLPMHIIAFAVDDKLFRHFSKIFTDVYRDKQTLYKMNI